MVSSSTITICKQKLLLMKYELINQIKSMKNDFNLVDKSRGDESDLASAHQEEHHFLVKQNRLKQQLLEIESALSRIEQGTYGVCEMTEEAIEVERLIALPWTRFSIEGAEIKESQNRRAHLKAI